MKLQLSAANLTPAILALALSVLVGMNAMGATSTTGNAATVHSLALPYKLQCGGFGMKQVAILNVGKGPVPAGTTVQWQLPKEVHLVGSTAVTFPAQSGVYTFQNPLAPGGQVGINVPSPAPESGGGPPPDPTTVALVGTLLRTCTIGPAPRNFRMMPH
jgi:hypothetical protein